MNMKFARSDKAVSEVMGMVLVLCVALIVIGAIMLVGVPSIEAGKHNAKMDVMANSFLSLQNDIEESVRGPIWIKDPSITTNFGIGSSRDSEFEIADGSISSLPGTGMYCIPANCSSSSLTIVMTQGNITYSSGNGYNDDIIYENGAVIRKYESGIPLMVSDPLVNIYNVDGNSNGNISIYIHAININGTLSSIGGEGKAFAEIRLQNYSPTIEPTVTTPNLNKLNITINTKYPIVWENYFDTKLKEAGLVNSNKGNDTGYNISGFSGVSGSGLNVEIYGNSKTTQDIYLALYQSNVSVNMR